MLGFTASLAVGLRCGAVAVQRCPTRVTRTILSASASAKPAKPVSELVASAISDNAVMVYSKSACPYCKNAKALLRQEVGDAFEVWELNQMDNGPEIQDYLQSLTGQRTVPNIFINGDHIGGCDDLMELHYAGKLKAKITSG
jgi:glutaredoxin 3